MIVETGQGGRRALPHRRAGGATRCGRARSCSPRGAIGTPELLLSQGIAELVRRSSGRNLRIHPACWVGARFDEEVRGWDGVMQSWYVDEWNDRGLFLEATFTPFAFGAHWLPGAGPAFKRADRALRQPRGDRRPHVRPQLARPRPRRARADRASATGSADEDAQAIRYGIARAADIHFAAGAVEVYPQVGGLPCSRPGRAGRASIERGRFRARDLRLEAFHPMGTARMGADRASSVVSPAGEAHDVARPLRRGRVDLPDVAAGQPDDHDHGLRPADRARNRRAS